MIRPPLCPMASSLADQGLWSNAIQLRWLFRSLNIENWDLFVIWCLRFGILSFYKSFLCNWFRIYFDVTLSVRLSEWLWCFNHRPRLNATGADHHLFDCPVWNRPHSLKIWIKSTFGHIVSMAHIAPHHGFFTAYFTYLGHDDSPLNVKKTNIKTISSTLNASGCKELFNFFNLKSSNRLKMWSGPV